MNWGESYLPGISGRSSLNWHTFHHIYIAFWLRWNLYTGPYNQVAANESVIDIDSV